MPQPPFLGRSQELTAFRSGLSEYRLTWIQRNFPTFARLGAKPAPAKPAIFLFYGEGGMGKSTLTRKLEEIVHTEFSGQFQSLFLDWEKKRDLNPELQEGHDYIRPETIMGVLYKALVDQGWGSCFESYRQQWQKLQDLETKVDQELRSQPGENPLLSDLAKVSSQGIAFLIRQSTGLPSGSPETIEKTLKVSAETLYQARQLVQKTLAQKDYDLYAHPHERLGEALGDGLNKLAQRQPLVLLLDTYEIVDRPECDYTLRYVMQHSGGRVIWVISGRANLADSGQRGNSYFRGYKRDFGEDRLYAKPLSEFSLEEIQQYVATVVPERSITEEQAEAIARFSQGIPFVVSQVATLYREGKPLDEIVQPVSVKLGTSSRYTIIQTICERLLVHCFSAKEKEQDLQAIYALALLRRPNPELLREMLGVSDGLEQRLQTLRERYSFVSVEELHLDQKFTTFLQDYLLHPLRRTDPMVQRLHEQAIAWLELQIEANSQGITDTADLYREERLSEWMLDLAHHWLWQSEEAGWRYLVPRFIESWQYNQSWMRRLLLDVVEPIVPYMGHDHRRRFQSMKAVLERQPQSKEILQLLEELENSLQRLELPPEHRLILKYQRGDVYYLQGDYQATLHINLDVGERVPASLVQLRKDLADSFYFLSGKFTWQGKGRDDKYRVEGEQAITKAFELHPDPKADYYHQKAAILAESKRYEEAIAFYQQAIALDPNNALPHSGLAIVYSSLKQYEQAIAFYQQAIALDPNNALPYNGLGTVYRELKQYEQAIAFYQQAITLDPNDALPHNGLGTVYRELKQYEQAIAFYQQAITLDPNDTLPHNGLGTVYTDLKQHEQALASYQQAIALDPNNAFSHSDLGTVYRELKQYEQAIASYQQAIDLDSNDTLPHNGLGTVYTDLKQYELAIASYQQAITLDPNNAFPHNGLGTVYHDLKQYEQAIAFYQQAIALDPNDAHYHYNLGIVYRDLKQYEQAIASCQQAIALDPNNAFPHNGLGTVYRNLKQYEQALASYQQAIDLDPNDADYHYNLGTVYRNLKQYELALASYQQAIALDPNDAHYHYNLGIVYRNLKQYEQAIASCQQAIALDPNNAFPHNGLGTVYTDLKQYELALASYQQAIALDPNDADYHYNLGIVYRELKQYEQAIASCQQAITLDPNNAFPHNGLGIVYRELKQYEQAIASYQQAIDLDPNDAHYHYNLGNVHRDLKQYEQAIASYQQAIDLDPNDADYHYNLGNVHRDLKQYEQAIASYQQAIALNPNDADYHYNLGNVHRNLKQYEQAIASYQQAIALNPNDADCHNGLGWVYLLNNQLTESQTAFEAEICLNSEDYSPFLNLGLVCAMQGNLDPAHTYWRQGLERIKDNDDWDDAVRALYVLALGAADQGIADMQQVITGGASVDTLNNALEDAEILARCPQPPARIDDMVQLLKAAITEQDS